MTATAFDALFQQTLWLAGVAFVLMFMTHAEYSKDRWKEKL